jgi:hypothetical protein
MEPTAPPEAPPPLRSGASAQPGSDMLEAGERLLGVVQKHWIGIVGIYTEAIVGVIAIIAVFFTVSPDTFKHLSGGAASLVVVGGIVGLTAVIFFLFVATYIYRQTRFLITDRGLVQYTQSSLFIRKVTRLSFSNVEDVSAEQRGILPTILNYGTMLVQTAGALDNFEFKYCPNPTRYADIIIEAREAYAQSLREENEHH